MKPATALSIIVLTVLSGCATPPPGELILTQEDMRLKSQAPPCEPVVTRHVAVTYSK